MQFPRDTDYIAQVIKELFDQGLFPIWERDNSYLIEGVYSLVNKDLIHDVERWCSETRYATAIQYCIPKRTVAQTEFLDNLNLKLSRQLYGTPYDADLPIIPIEELEEWGCTTETLTKSLKLVPDLTIKL